MPTITATFIPGTIGPGTDFTATTCLYHLDGQPTGYASDTICTLIDSHGFDYDTANTVVYRMWDLAALAPTHTVTDVACLHDLVFTAGRRGQPRTIATCRRCGRVS